MLKLIIEDDEGRKTVVPFVREEITIGRQEGNTIRLTERNVSRKHARLVRQNGHVLVEDLGSYNGIRINGEKITGRSQVNDGDLIQIGDYDLAIQHEVAAQAPPPVAPVAHPPAAANGAAKAHPPPAAPQVAPPLPSAPPPPPAAAEPEVEEAEEEAEEEEQGLGAGRAHATSVIRIDEIEGNDGREVVDIDAAEAPRLVCLNTEYGGREYACIRSELKIGRTEENDIAIDHRSLSRTHAKIVRAANGEWRIVDQQSANGLQVNGESYAQATLKHGDTLTLGHVKLKFVGPGKDFKYVPGAADQKPRGSRAPLAIAAVVGLAAIGGTAFLLFGRGERGGESGPPEKTEIAQTPKPPQPPPTKKPEVAVVTPPAPPPPAAMPPAQDLDLGRKVAAAKASVVARDFNRAAELFESLKGTAGLTPAQAQEVEEGLNQARSEAGFKKKLALAQKAFAAGKLPEAARLTDESEATVAFADDRQKLRERIDAALGAKAPKEPPHPKQVKVAETRPAKPSPADQARQYYDDGIKLYKGKDFHAALTQLKKCAEIAPDFAPCHKWLGSTYAQLRDLDQGAQHYRLFLRLAPDDPSADKVRTMLEEYERTQKK